MPVTRKQKTSGHLRPVFGRSLKEFQGGPPQLFRDLLGELKRFLGTETLFTKPESPEKLNLMRKAWDMGKDPLMIMRSSPHALASALKLWLSCLPEPLLPADMGNILLQATVYCQGSERLHVLQQVFNHIDRTTLQVLFPLVELLHHHRLNIRQPDSLAATFAPLLMPEMHPHPSTWDSAAVREALTDTLITSYRTIFAGAVPSSLSSTMPEAPVSPIAGAIQKGVFGGHDAVNALFGRGRGTSDGPESDAERCQPCSMAVDEVPSADGAVPAGWSCALGLQEDAVVPEVQEEVERLLSGSLDSVLFAEDDWLFAKRCEKSFALPAGAADMAALSERSASVESCRSDTSDDVSARLAIRRHCGKKEQQEQSSPTSHVPEQRFCLPHVQDGPAHPSFAYLHAEIYAAMRMHAAALDQAGGHCWAGSPFLGPAQAAEMRAEACQEHFIQRSLKELGAWDNTPHDTTMRQAHPHLLPKPASGGRMHVPAAGC
ncbi:probable rho GTPase-activating protein 45 at N-terminal half [Coccomyxa sp. Obi]|nr:probable rho GTPase-activating protein 45 at N-terminal half [Coccomyxa sp. Obi]